MVDSTALFMLAMLCGTRGHVAALAFRLLALLSAPEQHDWLRKVQFVSSLIYPTKMHF